MIAEALRLSLALLAFSPVTATAQGFARLGTSAEGFAMPDPETPLGFPADHGPHTDFRIEWWYLTAVLTGPDGSPYGAQWTLFRTAFAPGEGEGWNSPQVWLGHAAVTTATTHRSAERRGRGGIGQAGVATSPFAAWIDDWRMAGAEDLSRISLHARATDFSYDLDMTANGPLVLHGDAGYSVKSADGQASHYYSQPFYATAGTLRLPEGDIPVTGLAWLDREWSSQPLASDQSGWDWFSLYLDNGARLMAFRLRGARGDFLSGTWIDADGTAAPLDNDTVRIAPVSPGTPAPVRWRLEIPSRNLDVAVDALNPDAWMNTSVRYWEGPVTVTGSHSGRGYLEMTGYE